MILRTLAFIVTLTIALSCLPGSSVMATDPDRTNVVLILTDNHAAWTLGCYGNPDIRTPNIDRLAQEGIRFTQCYSVNAVCSPTRATLLTGLIPSQHGVHCFLRAGGAQTGPEAYNTINEFHSLPEILAESGYVCGMIGKWHLGDNLNPQERFSYWITMPHGSTRTFYDAKVIENGRIRTEPSYLTDFWTDHAIRFIEENKDRPFFLYLPYNGPYGLGRSLLKPTRNRHAEYYADKPLESFPREPVHPWLYNNRQYVNNIQAIRRYAAEISGIDDSVGRVMQTIKRLGLDKNTLVIFTGDQGLAGGQNGIWGMGDHTRPLHTFDPGVRVPMICHHPNRISPGSISDLMISEYDLLPTLLNYLGMKDKTPTEPALPGRDYSPVLAGKKIDGENIIFYEFENTRMVRTADWKYTRRFPDGPNELYHLSDDPGERKNLADLPRHAKIEEEMARQLFTFFNRYADPKFDLWRGGSSKTYQLLHPETPPWQP